MNANTLRPDAAALLAYLVANRCGLPVTALTSDERFGFDDLRVAGLAECGSSDDVVRATTRGRLAMGR